MCENPCSSLIEQDGCKVPPAVCLILAVSLPVQLCVCDMAADVVETISVIALLCIVRSKAT